MKNLIYLPLCFTLVSCWWKPDPGSFDPMPTKPVEERPDVAPEGSRVVEGARESSRQGRAVDANVNELRRKIDMATTAEARARAALDALIDKQSATVEELTDVRFLLGDVTKMNLDLKLQVEDLKELTTALTQQLDAQENVTASLQARLLEKDKEVADLRNNEKIHEANTETLVRNRDEWEKTAGARAEEARKAKEAADKLEGEIRVWRIAGWSLLGLIALFLILRFLVPGIIRAARGGIP